MLPPLLHLHETKIENVHRPIRSEFYVDGTFQTDVAVVSAGRTFAGIADEILHRLIVHIHLNDLVPRRPGELEARGIKRRPIAHQRNDGDISALPHLAERAAWRAKIQLRRAGKWSKFRRQQIAVRIWRCEAGALVIDQI